MNLLGNIIWWIFGGIATAFEYATLGVLYCASIIGIPWGLQCFKLALVMLWPFGSHVSEERSGVFGCLGNIIWIFIGGFWIAMTHLLFGVLLSLTIIGIPFGMKHFKLAKLAFTPFGRDINIG